MESTSVITNEVRFSYPYVFKPRDDDDGEGRYTLMILVPKKDKEGVAKIKKAIRAALIANKEKLKIRDVDDLPSNFNYPLRDGDKEKDEEAYDGMFFMNCNAQRKPGVVGKNPQKAITDPEELYPGCYGRASLNFYAYDFKGKKGIGCGLNNLQKLREGDRLDGGKSAFEDFDDGYEYTGDDDYQDDYKPEKTKTSTKSKKDDWI